MIDLIFWIELLKANEKKLFKTLDNFNLIIKKPDIFSFILQGRIIFELKLFHICHQQNFLLLSYKL